MQRLVSMMLVAIFALTLAGCATTGSGDKVRVKCPSCGYEFDAPTP